MLQFQNNADQEMKFLTSEQLREKAPTVFSESPSPNVSEHYTHIPTSRVVSDMELLGWGVVDAKEVKARTNIGSQKHLLVFQNPEVRITAEDGDVIIPQILLQNSHDGKSAFKFIVGLFRMICENGLIVSTQEFENVSIRHMGYTFEELQKQLREMVAKLPLTIESLNKMKETELAQEQILEFAERSLLTRFKESELENITIDLEDLVEPTRVQDKGNDLWSIYNIIQEKLIKGEFNYSTGVKTRKARKIKNFQQDQEINKKLFNLALEYAN